MKCLNCGSSISNRKVITPPNSNVSYGTITKAMGLLKDVSITFSGATKILDIVVNTLIRIFDKYISILRISLPKVICKDEIYKNNNSYSKSKYSCIIYDFEKRSVVDVLPCRRKDYLSHYLDKIDKNERNNVKW